MLEFGYCDWNGRISAVTNGIGFMVEYMHDIMDRVTNISWRTTSGATRGGFEYEYDAAGRIVSRDHTLGDPSQMSQSSQKNYTYDDLDRLATDGDVSYTYDAAGNRMTRTEEGETITYTLGVGDRLASYGRARSPSAPQYVVGACTYDAWGNVVDEEITTSASVLSNIRYRFQCREWSAATGLVNFRMRWYDAETGRWLSKDPIGLRGGLNLYAFCQNCPSIFRDPSGQISVEEIRVLIAAFGEGFVEAINDGE